MKGGDLVEEGEMRGALGKRKRGGGGVLGGGESMIVFCNTVGCCRSLEYTLREWGVNPSHYHSKMVCSCCGCFALVVNIHEFISLTSLSFFSSPVPFKKKNMRNFYQEKQTFF